MFWDEKGCFGGEDEVELKEPCGNGLLERLEGLVLLGLGPPAILSFVLPLSQWPSSRQSGAVVAGRGLRSEQMCGLGDSGPDAQCSGSRGGARVRGRRAWEVKQLRNVVMPGQHCGGLLGSVSRTHSDDWRATAIKTNCSDRRGRRSPARGGCTGDAAVLAARMTRFGGWVGGRVRGNAMRDGAIEAGSDRGWT